ncbi:hypothetical protein N7507_011289 [Penicillium longicatenatum]|nr:hypothetical protein N7507_011289 [Penicillium longicatenatum]
MEEEDDGRGKSGWDRIVQGERRELDVRKDRAREDAGICKAVFGELAGNVDQQNSKMLGFIEDNAMRRPLGIWRLS